MVTMPPPAGSSMVSPGKAVPTSISNKGPELTKALPRFSASNHAFMPNPWLPV